MSSVSVKRKFFISKSDYKPKRLGLIYNPSSIGILQDLIFIVIEYLIPSTNQLYHHKIRLKTIPSISNSSEIIKWIYEHHSEYLDNKRINKDLISKLVEKLLISEKKRSTISLKQMNLIMSQTLRSTWPTIKTLT